MLRHGAPLKLWRETGVPLELQQGTGFCLSCIAGQGVPLGLQWGASRVVLGRPFSSSDVRVATH